MKTRIKPLTDEEVKRLFAEQRWPEIIQRLRDHFELCAPLLPQILAALTPIEREQFMILYLDFVKLTDGAVH